MNDLADRYVIANAIGCVVALIVHVGVLHGLTVVAGFAMFVPTFVCFGATMATHPEAEVTRLGPIPLGVRMGAGVLWRTVPRWALAITACFIAYLGWFFFDHRAEMHGQYPPTAFASLFAGVCAHLFWGGVGTRLGALRSMRQQGSAGSARA
jgi:hypothetical protein